MKPGPKPKTERNAEVLRLRRAGWTLARIGRRFGFSRQRACEVCWKAARLEREAARSG